MASNLKTKKFTSQFERWVGTPPAGCRFLFNDAVTGKPYWITREDFLNGFNGTSDSGASAYQIYAATTSDNPVLSESAWIDSLYGQDGVTPTIGSNGNWFIGDTDTGVKAQPENPIPAAQIYNAPMGAVIFFVGLLSSLSDSWHLANGDVVEGFGPTIDMRGKVPLGYDDREASTPTNATGLVKNYGAIGNTGGKSWYKLTGQQSGVPVHDHDVPASTGTVDGTGSQQGIKPPGTTKIKTSPIVAKEALEDHENRMEYVVGAYIQRVKPEVVSGGNGKSAYQSYLDTTTDDPKLTEAEWVAAMKGIPGTNGRGIVSNEKTATNGLVDTYTITYTDGSTSTYYVTNGASDNSISNIHRYFSNETYRYFGTAPSESLETDSIWTIKRILLNYNGSISISIATDVKWTDKLTINYI